MNKKGFTLVEILVSVTVFVVITTITIASLHTFISFNLANQKERESLQNLSFIFDLINREAKLGQDYKCVDAIAPDRCLHISFLTKEKIGDSELNIVEYRFYQKSIENPTVLERMECGYDKGSGDSKCSNDRDKRWIPISDPDNFGIDINRSYFQIFNEPNIQSYIKIIISANYKNIRGDNKPINLRTQVTQRIFGGSGVTTDDFTLEDEETSSGDGYFYYSGVSEVDSDIPQDSNVRQCVNGVGELVDNTECDNFTGVARSIQGTQIGVAFLVDNGRIYYLSVGDIESIIKEDVERQPKRVCANANCEYSDVDNDPINIDKLIGSTNSEFFLAQANNGYVYLTNGSGSSRLRTEDGSYLEVDFIKYSNTGNHILFKESGRGGRIFSCNLNTDDDGSIEGCSPETEFARLSGVDDQTKIAITSESIFFIDNNGNIKKCSKGSNTPCDNVPFLGNEEGKYIFKFDDDILVLDTNSFLHQLGSSVISGHNHNHFESDTSFKQTGPFDDRDNTYIKVKEVFDTSDVIFVKATSRLSYSWGGSCGGTNQRLSGYNCGLSADGEYLINEVFRDYSGDFHARERPTSQGVRLDLQDISTFGQPNEKRFIVALDSDNNVFFWSNSAVIDTASKTTSIVRDRLKFSDDGDVIIYRYNTIEFKETSS